MRPRRADKFAHDAGHAETFATLQALNLKGGRAWAIKEALRLWTVPARTSNQFVKRVQSRDIGNITSVQGHG